MTRVGSKYNMISGFILGDTANLTIKTVGMKLNTPWKISDLTNNGMNRMKVANTSTNVMAELASLVLSTSMDMSTPTPMKANPMKNKTSTKRAGLNMGTRIRSRTAIHAMLCKRENKSIGIILPIITM